MDVFEQEFWSNVMPSADGCWLWIGGQVNNKGYGRFHGMFVHRLAYVMIHDEPLEKGMCVLHRCDTPLCVHPDHLWIGTKSDNRRDCIAKGRANHQINPQTHCKNGHEFTPENTIVTPLQRICRKCANKYQREWRNAQIAKGKKPRSAMSLKERRELHV